MFKAFPFCFLRFGGWQRGGQRHGTDVRLSTYVYHHCAESWIKEWRGCRRCSPEAFQRGKCNSWLDPWLYCVRVYGPRGCSNRSCSTGHVSWLWASCALNLFFISKAWRFHNVSIQLYCLRLVWELNFKIDFHRIQAQPPMMSKEDVNVCLTYSEHNATWVRKSCWLLRYFTE